MPRKTRLEQRIERLEKQLEEDRKKLAYWQTVRTAVAKERAAEELKTIKALGFQGAGTYDHPLTKEPVFDASLAIQANMRAALLQGVLDGAIDPSYVIPPTQPEQELLLKIKLAQSTLDAALPPEERAGIFDEDEE